MKFNFKSLIPIVIAGAVAVIQEIGNQKQEKEFEELKERVAALENNEDEA